MKKQLIHADPRIANVMFKNEQPFVFIDWGGLMVADPMIDLGDLLGALVKESELNVNSYDLENVIAAYYDYQGGTHSKDELISLALQSSYRIALDSTMRHLIDSVEDYYFSFDSSKYNSRKEFNFATAERGYQVAQFLKSCLASFS